MNLTKKIFCTLVFACLTILSIQAQPARGEGGRRGGDPTERANLESEKMIKALDLSVAQGEKVKAVNLEFVEKMQAMRAEMREPGASREDMREKMKTLRTTQRAELRKYLTAEQIEKWEKIQAERPARGPRKSRKGKEKNKS